MTFKEQLKEDTKIFINLDEFAEEIIVDKKKYQGIITHPTHEEPKNEYEGVYSASELKLYLIYDSSLKKYTSGKSVTVNNNFYIVHRAYEEEGIFVLELLERGRF